VNFIGEHTDYNDGFALPLAISEGVFIAAAARDDGIVALASRQYGGDAVAVRVAELRPGRPDGWAAYPAGVIWALRAAGHQVGGVSLAIDSDLPPGAGLSSSAAIESAAGLAVNDLWHLELARPQLAAIGRRAENDFVGAPTGIMDQLAVMLGRAGHALLLDCRAGTGTPVPFDPALAGLDLLVIDTRVAHALTDGGYQQRRRSCEDAALAMGVRSLRDVTDATAADRLADPVLRRRARHVITENGRVLATAELLRAGQVRRTGPLLTASHRSLADDFEVSWPQADAAVQAAVEAGAVGARMTGGGFGGSVIVLAPAAAAADVAAAITAAYARRRWPPPSIRPARPSAGARRLR
jgi:galactokinase